MGPRAATLSHEVVLLPPGLRRRSTRSVRCCSCLGAIARLAWRVAEVLRLSETTRPTSLRIAVVWLMRSASMDEVFRLEFRLRGFHGSVRVLATVNEDPLPLGLPPA